MSKRNVIAPLLILMSVLAAGYAQADERPPLSVPRVAGELLAGYGGQIAGSWMALGIAEHYDWDWHGYSGWEDEYDYLLPVVHILSGPMLTMTSENGWKYRITSLLCATLGSAVAVYAVGDTDRETGSFLATWGGSIVGGLGAAGLIVGMELLYRTPARRVLSYAAGCVLAYLPIVPTFLVISVAPSIGATVGFNMTRRYKLSDNLKEQTVQAAPVFRFNLASMRF